MKAIGGLLCMFVLLTVASASAAPRPVTRAAAKKALAAFQRALDHKAEMCASGDGDTDARCNRVLMIGAEVISQWSAGTFVPADAVVAWCLAAEIETDLKELLNTLWSQDPEMWVQLQQSIDEIQRVANQIGAIIMAYESQSVWRWE
jgi:hypothetical protein